MSDIKTLEKEIMWTDYRRKEFCEDTKMAIRNKKFIKDEVELSFHEFVSGVASTNGTFMHNDTPFWINIFLDNHPDGEPFLYLDYMWIRPYDGQTMYESFQHDIFADIKDEYLLSIRRFKTTKRAS